MKKIFLILLAFSVFSCNSQSKKQTSTIIKKKKEFVWPNPIGDTTWFTNYCDTVWGKIEIQVGSGIMVGDGLISSCMTYQFEKAVYSKKDQAAIDSFYKSQEVEGEVWTAWGGGGSTGFGTTPYPHKRVHIKTKEGWILVTDKFTFTPY